MARLILAACAGAVAYLLLRPPRDDPLDDFEFAAPAARAAPSPAPAPRTELKAREPVPVSQPVVVQSPAAAEPVDALLLGILRFVGLQVFISVMVVLAVSLFLGAENGRTVGIGAFGRVQSLHAVRAGTDEAPGDGSHVHLGARHAAACGLLMEFMIRHEQTSMTRSRPCQSASASPRSCHSARPGTTAQIGRQSEQCVRTGRCSAGSRRHCSRSQRLRPCPRRHPSPPRSLSGSAPCRRWRRRRR